MKFTHRAAGPRKGGGGGPSTVKVRQPPKAKPARGIGKRYRHAGAIATIGDAVRDRDRGK